MESTYKKKKKEHLVVNTHARRGFLKVLLFGLTGFVGLCNGLFFRALAMGKRQYPQGIREIKGDVRINGTPADKNSVINFGDTVMTGSDGRVLFVVERSVYLLREKTTVTVSREQLPEGKEKTLQVLKIIQGKVLSVFGKGRKRVETSTAVIGVRGTAMYLEVEPEKVYICTCYGKVDIIPKADPEQKEIIRTFHHEKPRWIFGKGQKEIITKAPMKNHTDAELVLLESFVGRTPPFMESPFYKNSDGGGGSGGGGGY